MMEWREMRAGDGDRQGVADQLRAALEEGRLDIGEYDDRLQKAYSAKTFADLEGLLTDLPGTTPPSRQQIKPYRSSGGMAVASGKAQPSEQHPDATRRWLAHTWDGYAGTVAIVVAIWAVICLMTQQWLYFWPGWVAGPWGAVLIVVSISGLINGEPQRWAAKQAREEQKKRDEEAEDDKTDEE